MAKQFTTGVFSAAWRLRFPSPSFLNLSVWPKIWIGSFSFIYTCLFSLRIDPPAAGWILFPLQSKTLIPYKDFFDPVPPLSYFESQITSSQNFGLRNLIILGCFAFAMFGVSLYTLARQFFGVKSSTLLSIFSVVMLQSLRLEVSPGWNTQFFIYLTIGVALLMRSLINNLEEATDGSLTIRPKNSIIYAFVSGIFFSFALLEKQTAAFSLISSVFTFTAFSYMHQSRVHRERVKHVCRWFFLGLFLPLALSTLFLLKYGALGSFLKDMLSGGGKSPRILDGLKYSLNIFVQYVPFRTILPALILLFFSFRVSNSKLLSSVARVQTALFLAPVVSYFFWITHNNYNNSKTFSVEISSIIITVIFNQFLKRKMNYKAYLPLIVLLGIFLSPVCFIMFSGGSDTTTKLQYLGVSTSSFISVNLIIFLFTFSQQFLHLSLFNRSRAKNLRIKYYSSLANHSKIALVIANGLTIGAFINVFSSGGGIYPQWFIPQYIIYFGTLLPRSLPTYVVRVSAAIFQFWTFLSILSLCAVSIVSPYAWFNWSETSILSHHVKTKVPGNYGIFLSDATRQVYQRLFFDGKKALTLTTTQAPTVFAFPNIPNFATATGLTQYQGIKCLVLWFDVCPNSVAARDLEYFKVHQPDLVIWSNIPEYHIAGNERVFVHRRSSLRDWQSFRDLQVAQKKWRKIDSFIPQTMNGWGVDVYLNIGNQPTRGKFRGGGS